MCQHHRETLIENKISAFQVLSTMALINTCGEATNVQACVHRIMNGDTWHHARHLPLVCHVGGTIWDYVQLIVD